MISKKYQCRQYGCKFEIKIFESGEERQEWERRNKRPAGPVRCKKCGSVDVIEL